MVGNEGEAVLWTFGDGKFAGVSSVITVESFELELSSITSNVEQQGDEGGDVYQKGKKSDLD